MNIEGIKYAAYVKSYIKASAESPKVYFSAMDMLAMDSRKLYATMMSYVLLDPNLIKTKRRLEKELEKINVYPDWDSYCTFAQKILELDNDSKFPSNMLELNESLKMYLCDPRFKDEDYSTEISNLAVMVFEIPFNEKMADEIVSATEKLIDIMFK